MRIHGLLSIFIIACFFSQIIDAQSSYTPEIFGPIYFNENVDTIDAVWYPRMDSLGVYLKTHPGFFLHVDSHGLETESDFLKSVSRRADITLNYLRDNHQIDPNRVISVSAHRWSIDDAAAQREPNATRKVQLTIVTDID